MASLDMADVKPSVMSWIIVGLMSVTFIVLMKYVTDKWYIPGMSEVFMAA